MPTSLSQYYFGNSLVNFAEGGSATNLPVWLDLLAESAGNSYAMSGGYGFLRDFADRPEPLSQWGFEGVQPAWDSAMQSFAEAPVDMILIAPANFIQDRAPDAAYAGDSRSPFDAVMDIVTGLGSDQPQATIWIYEGWADLSAFSAFPPDDTALAAYHDYNAGAYHDWYLSLIDMVNDADPDAQVQLLPVASILSDLYSSVLSDLPATALYVDDAPHGTETTYFLASLIVYNAGYGTPAPAPDQLPDSIHPAVAERYDDILATIETGLQEAGILADGGSDAEPGVEDMDDGDEDGEDDAPTDDTPPETTPPETSAPDPGEAPTPGEDPTDMPGTITGAPPSVTDPLPEPGDEASTECDDTPVDCEPPVPAALCIEETDCVEPEPETDAELAPCDEPEDGGGSRLYETLMRDTREPDRDLMEMMIAEEECAPRPAEDEEIEC
ncbi:hypothetical protein [Salipiger sp.]|uniref:hypothetical protein n=1 Tax=Salipiger sp. TaxID=2078585 RepID=UPI003A982375